MERTVIVAMSPRVGRWNHRYFTPSHSHSHIAERDAARLVAAVLDSSNRNDSIVYAQTPVKQLSSGRVNMEVLLVKDARLSTKLSVGETDKTKSILVAFLPTLESIVKGLTEAEGASDLIIRHEALDVLYASVRDHLSTLPPVPKVGDGGPRTSNLGAGSFSVKKYSPYFIGIIGLALVFGLLWIFWPFSEAKPQFDSTDLKNLHDAVLGDARPGEEIMFDSTNEQRARIREILECLKSDLKTSGDSKSNTASVAPTPSQVEKEFESILSEYYQAIFGKSNSGSLDSLLKNESFIANLGKMFTPKFRPEACITVEKKRAYLTQFECTGSRHFREVFNALVELQKAAGSEDKGVTDKQKKDWAGCFIADFPTEPALTYIPEEHSDRVRCYREEDADNAAKVARLLEKHKGKEVPRSIKSLRESVQKASDRWTREPLMSALKDSTANEHTARAFRALKELGRVWSSNPSDLPSTIEPPTQ